MLLWKRKALLLPIVAIALIHDTSRCCAHEPDEEDDELPLSNGINFLGIGYNLIDGNPEGGDLRSGGVDPGLKLSRRIFKFTYEQGKTTSDLKNKVPDEVTYVKRDSAFTSSSLQTFSGTGSYANKLSAQVSVSAGYEGLLASVQFAASARYQQVSDRTSSQGSVFLSNETISNLGTARYQTNLASSGKYLLDDGFVADACRLPASYTDTTKENFMRFIDDWGTHIVTEVALGIREGENFEEQRSSFVNYAAQNVGGSVSASGGYAGFQASVEVNMDSFNSEMSSQTQFGKTYSKYKVGSDSLNEPISIKLIAMPEVFEAKYWTGLDTYIKSGHCTSSFERGSVKQNLDTALAGYAAWRKIKESTNPRIRIPVTWPEGTYALPKAISGCPNKEFTWNEGWRIHQQRLNDARNTWSDWSFHLSGWKNINGAMVEQDFCVKTVRTVDSRSQWQWQPGTYCVFKYGASCPSGFQSGFILWDDTPQGLYGNAKSGVLPSGKFDDDTQLDFCCRNDGVTNKGINLPIDNNFYLFARFDQCQQVNGMKVAEEWIMWDTGPNSKQSDVHPYPGVDIQRSKGVRVNYCYYYTGKLTKNDRPGTGGGISDFIPA